LHTSQHIRRTTLAVILTLAGTALLPGCGTKKQSQDPGELIGEIDAQISKLTANYEAIKKAAPQLKSAMLEGPEVDAAEADKDQGAIAKAVSESENAVALIDSNVVKIGDMENAGGCKPYLDKENSAQETRKKAWAQVKVWWDGYESALQGARTLSETGTYMADEFPPEYKKSAALLQSKDWQGAKDALTVVSRRLRTEAEALAGALEDLKIESAPKLTDAVGKLEEMIRLNIEFCDAGIANDATRQMEISKEIEASAAQLQALAIDPDTIGTEIRTQLGKHGADFDFSKADKLLREADKLEKKAQDAKPKAKTKAK
jgi:hypothetical protein